MDRRVARILGGRELLQALVELGSWPRWRRLGALVDGLHAGSLLMLATRSERWRHAAVLDALGAAAAASVGLRPGAGT